jgi:hypothetical protein
MTKDQKIIRGKIGLLELAKQLGNVSQACKMMGEAAQGSARVARGMAAEGTRATASTGSRNSTTQAANWRSRRSAAASRC